MTTKDLKSLGVHTMFGRGKLSVMIKGEYYLIEMDELEKMIKDVPLEIVKKRKYNYLIVKEGI